MFDRPLSYRYLPPAVKFLLTANAAAFVLQFVLGMFGGPSLVPLFGLTPALVLDRLWLWQPVTYMFLHGGLLHVLFNCFMLWTLGQQIERQWGTAAFLRFYFACGLGAAALNLLLEPHSTLPVIGASGAIYGLLVAFAMMFPMATFMVYFFIPMRAWQAVTLFAVFEFLIGFSGTASRLANFAHLGGMLTGYVYLKSQTMRYQTRGLTGRLAEWAQAKRAPKAKSRTEFHELGAEVDRILDKISSQGIDSLTPEERRLMERYSKMKTQN